MSAGMRRVRRIVLRAVLGLLIVVVSTLAALAWRLSRGPISLDFLTPRIEAALDRPENPFRIHVGGTEVAWAGRKRGVDLRARDVRAIAADGRTIAALPALAVDLRLSSLLHGSIDPTAIDLLGPSLRLVRHPDGDIDLGLGPVPADSSGDPLLEGIFRRLSAPPGGPGEPGLSLARVAISDGQVVLTDEESAEELRAPDLNVTLHRDESGIALDLSGKIEIGDEQISLRGRAHDRAGAAGATLEVTLNGLHPAALAERIAERPESLIARHLKSAVPLLERMGFAFDGTVRTTLDATWRPARVDVDLKSDAGTLALGDAGTLAVKHLELALAVDLAEKRAALDRLALDLDGPKVEASGTVASLDGPGALDVRLTVADMPIELAWRLWPEGVAASPRAWLTSNISRGSLPTVSVGLRGQVVGGDPGTLSGVAIDGAVRFDRLQVRFLDTMPPVTGVVGGGTFSQSGFDLRVERGGLSGIGVGPASVLITGLDNDKPRIKIDASVRGPLRDTLRVLDARPLEIAHALGVDPARASGSMSGRVGFDFPLDLDGSPDARVLGLAASARLDEVELPPIVGGWEVTEGDLDLEVDPERVAITGDAALAGVPVAVAWQEFLDSSSKLQRTANFKGTVDAAGRKALGFDLQPMLTGPVVVNFDLREPWGGGGQGSLALDLSRAAIDVPELHWQKPAGAPGKASAHLALTGTRLDAVDPFSIDAGGLTASGRAVRDVAAGRWRHLETNATLAAHAAEQAPAKAEVAADAIDAGYRFRISSNDTGALFNVLGLYTDARGGRLTFAGTADPAVEGLPFSAKLEVTDVAIVRAPWLARAATLASLRGIADAFSSNTGIAFDRVSADLSRTGRVLTVADGVAAGQTLGLLISGTLDQASSTVTMRGTLVPALYGLNRALGEIPVVGWVIGGGREGGPVGVEFSVDGPASDPNVAVHPIESIAPGLFKRLAGLMSGKSSAER